MADEPVAPVPEVDNPFSRYEWAHPWIVKEAVDFLDGYVQPWMRVFEWGSGGSTTWFASRARKVTTVEHQTLWAHALVLHCRSKAIKNIDVLEREAVYPDFEEYANAIKYEGMFDIIMIDGADGYDLGLKGSRPACAKRALEHISPGGVIALDNAGSASNIEAADLITARFSDRRKYIGYVLEPPEHPRNDQTETSIWICP